QQSDGPMQPTRRPEAQSPNTAGTSAFHNTNGRRQAMAMPAVKQKKKPSFFKMRAQMLEKGRTNTALARTENMWATLKVYASGGENGLHTHPNEDHVFIVLQGSARYYDADGGYTDVGKHEGIMLPAGA